MTSRAPGVCCSVFRLLSLFAPIDLLLSLLC